MSKKEPGRKPTPTGSDANLRVRISQEHEAKLEELLEELSFLSNKTQAVAYIIDRFFSERSNSKKFDNQPIEDDTGEDQDLLGAFFAA